MKNIIWIMIGSAGALLTTFGFVPQIIKMLKTKSVGDVSKGSLIQLIIGVILWILYGIHLNDYILIIANSLTFLTLITALIIYSKFDNK